MQEILFNEYIDRTINRQEIHEKLASYYKVMYEDMLKRDLKTDILFNAYDNIGTIIFSLNGTPPKGYAIYTPELKRIIFFSSALESFGEYTGVHGIRGLLN